MSEQEIPLWPTGAPEPDRVASKEQPRLVPHLVDAGTPTGAVIVCPGGGYGKRAPHEGDPVARMFNGAGISAFVLHYRIAPHRHPVPLLDAQRAIRLVRQRAEAWRIRPDRIALLGFSAGGHLAATASTHFDAGDPQADDPVDRESSRPDASILCYAVISFLEFGHVGSMKNLLGEDPPADLRQDLSNELRITPETPPAFLWHTGEDLGVPVQNSLQYAAALREHGVPYSLHVFPQGRHGLGLAAETPGACQWPSLCTAWLKSLGF